ncbi:hypothetical protein JXB27_01665 [Candidatus Woesearchaeota archaeon]|nr:hypothetical protein [Candidatus Woesearchaeota archaeon]
MSISDRNKKVAQNRWKKIHKEERKRIKNNRNAIIQKALLCGFIAGDGSVREVMNKGYIHSQINFFADDKNMLKDYTKAMNFIYGKDPSIKQEKNFIDARICSKTIVQDLKNTANFGIKKWSPPLSLFFVSGAKEAWIRGFFSAEAHVEKRAIKIQTVNEEGMKQISSLLKSMEIENKIYFYQPKKENYSKVTIIRITDRKSLETFSQKVGFSHEKKEKALKKALGL